MFFENKTDDTEISRMKNKNGKDPLDITFHPPKPRFQCVSPGDSGVYHPRSFSYTFTGTTVSHSYYFTAWFFSFNRVFARDRKSVV